MLSYFGIYYDLTASQNHDVQRYQNLVAFYFVWNFIKIYFILFNWYFLRYSFQKSKQGKSSQVILKIIGFQTMVFNICMLYSGSFVEKDLGFLRIGSLNVRVKKTTEAVSNFLGVGSTQHRMPPMTAMHNIRSSAPPSAAYFNNIHKNWGSADNIQVSSSPPNFTTLSLLLFLSLLWSH